MKTQRTAVTMLWDELILLWTTIAVLVIGASWCDAVHLPAITTTTTNNNNRFIYSRQTLLDLRPPKDSSPPSSLLNTLNWLEEAKNSRDAIQNNVFMKKKPTRKPRRKRGRRGGTRARLRRRGVRTPLPTITFGNVRSIRNKVDEFAANCRFIRDYRESGFIALTETWLQSKDDDGTVNIDGYTLVRGDRENVNKRNGGGVAVYINERWCTQVNVKEKFCNDNLEFLVVSCRPFYLPREFTNVTIITVYIPPSADAALAKEQLQNCVNKYENEHPEGIMIVLGDFNHCEFQPCVPTYQQTVTCPTRGNNILDKMYCNVKNGYRSFQKPKLGDSDHNMVFLAPVYKQILKSKPCEVISVREWNNEHMLSLQGCFECTEWNVLYDDSEDININLDVFNSYINFCTDMIVPMKKINVYPNNKPWINSDIRRLINEKKQSFILNGDCIQQRNIQRELKSKILDAKHSYKVKVENLFRSNKPKDAWKGVKLLCGSQKKKTDIDPQNIVQYVNDLNSFYARFDVHNFNVECENILSVVRNTDAERIIVTHENVSSSLKRIQNGKASGPDKIGSRLLKFCSEQLVDPLCKLFQASLDQGTVPHLWKTSEIVPVPKNNHPKEFNDLRPVALTSIIMKCLEHIVKEHLCTSINPLRDPLQFAYSQSRSVQDAVLTLVHQTSEHLETQNTQVRTLFVDFSSAFNTIQPHVLLTKLLEMNVNCNLLLWIYSYLTHRPQYTKIRNTISDTIFTNTGAPQGCVLSPLLFTLYTNNCRSSYPGCSIVKYADDTAIVGKIKNDNSEDFLSQVSEFVNWCNDNFLTLNVKKTKEMIIDFRLKEYMPDPIIINNEEVERVEEYKYLGIILDDKLTGSPNTQHVYKKCQQRIHFLRILNNIRVDQTILSLFYKSVVESILTFSSTVWYGKLTCKDKNKMKKIVKTAGKLRAKTVPLDDLYNSNVIKQVHRIMNDAKHPLNCHYNFLRSGKRLTLPMQRTNRYKNTFVPKSIKLYNYLIMQ